MSVKVTTCALVLISGRAVARPLITRTREIRPIEERRPQGAIFNRPSLEPKWPA